MGILEVSGAQGLRDINLCRKITRLIVLFLKAHSLKARIYWDHICGYKYCPGQVGKAIYLLWMCMAGGVTKWHSSYVFCTRINWTVPGSDPIARVMGMWSCTDFYTSEWAVLRTLTVQIIPSTHLTPSSHHCRFILSVFILLEYNFYLTHMERIELFYFDHNCRDLFSFPPSLPPSTLTKQYTNLQKKNNRNRKYTCVDLCVCFCMHV